ncbi:MAG: PIN domain-containing protein [bacterium]|nr:PIN domain-containing protein [bacterium]
MRNIFIDANVIIDWLVSDALNHNHCKKTIELTLNNSRNTWVSPTTIAITSYFLHKQFQSTKKVKALSASIYAPFKITTENEDIVRNAMQSKFTDLEDAIQYFSALNSKIDVIITQNLHDFKHSDIAVLSPEMFLQLYNRA